MSNINPDIFLKECVSGVVIDVRTPAEYESGHIPCAINIPIFSNEERAEVGTIYKKQSKEKAVERGLDIVGTKLGDFVRRVKTELKRRKTNREETTLYLYCWRGGMRSNSMAWLFTTAGFKVEVLRGGYKAYRASFIDKILKDTWKLFVLGGPTGCGKTYILEALKNKGEQVVDLEGIAKHRGSAFGNYGFDGNQPTSEHFSNMLYDELLKFDSSRYIWCEGESMSIGKVFMPQEFHRLIQNSELIHFEISRELRLDHIMQDYGDCPTHELKQCFENITKRLGYDNAKKAIEYIDNGDIRSAATIGLDYYDKGYSHSLNNRVNKIKYRIYMEQDDPNLAADKLIEKIKEIL